MSTDRSTPAERFAARAGADRLAWLASRTQEQLDRMADAIERSREAGR